jgi:hypothetical protein
MEKREYLDESQRAMKAARPASLLDGVRKDHAQGASIEAQAPMSQAEAAKSSGSVARRSSGQRTFLRMDTGIGGGRGRRPYPGFDRIEVVGSARE